MMDDSFWEQYADNAESHYNEEFAKFIGDLTISLKCSSVLEIGCNAGNDLKLFSESIKVNGLDYNEKIIDIAKKRFPAFDFKKGSVTNMPYEDSSIDLVFTHGFFNYLKDDMIDDAVAEMYRVAKKYIVNCEISNQNIAEKNNRKGRDMYKRWLEYNVKIISNVEMHEDIEPEKAVFVLVRKL